MLKKHTLMYFTLISAVLSCLLLFQNCGSRSSSSTGYVQDNSATEDFVKTDVETYEEFINMKSGYTYTITQDIDFKGNTLLRSFSDIRIVGNNHTLRNLKIQCTQTDSCSINASRKNFISGLNFNSCHIENLNIEISSDVTHFPDIVEDFSGMQLLNASQSILKNISVSWQINGNFKTNRTNSRLWFQLIEGSQSQIEGMTINVKNDVSFEGGTTSRIRFLSELLHLFETQITRMQINVDTKYSIISGILPTNHQIYSEGFYLNKSKISDSSVEFRVSSNTSGFKSFLLKSSAFSNLSELRNVTFNYLSLNSPTEFSLLSQAKSYLNKNYEPFLVFEDVTNNLTVLP